MRNKRSLSLLVSGILLWGCVVGMVPGCVAAQRKPFTGSSFNKDQVQDIKDMDVHYDMDLDDVYDNVDAFRDRTVIMKGRFMGWQGNCTYPPPVTRSDWMLHQHGRCIYVTGKVALNLDRQRNSPDIGRSVTVRGIIPT